MVETMKVPAINYPTTTVTKKIADKYFVLETIRNLDEAIDLLCESISAQDQLDPFAEDLCPYFGVLWPSAEALARFLGEHPELVKGKSVLELGCGLGLPSLVSHYLGAKVLATDFHPDVEKYFLRNCTHSSLDVPYKRFNWRSLESELGTFDVVIGSDILYESNHPEQVISCLLKFIAPGGRMILSDPGRAYLQKFLNEIKNKGLSEELIDIQIDEKSYFVFNFKKDLIADTV